MRNYQSRNWGLSCQEDVVCKSSLLSMLDVTHLHAVIKDTVRDESFVVAPLYFSLPESLSPGWM